MTDVGVPDAWTVGGGLVGVRLGVNGVPTEVFVAITVPLGTTVGLLSIVDVKRGVLVGMSVVKGVLVR